MCVCVCVCVCVCAGFSPVYMVDLVSVLAFLSILLVRLVAEDLDALTAARVVLAGLSHRVQLADLILCVCVCVCVCVREGTGDGIT